MLKNMKLILSRHPNVIYKRGVTKRRFKKCIRFTYEIEKRKKRMKKEN